MLSARKGLSLTAKWDSKMCKKKSRLAELFYINWCLVMGV